MSGKKKIGLVTIHFANSYGGLLQAYASQRYLEKFGDVKIVDYKTPHLSKTMKLLRLGDGPRGVLRAGKDLARLFPRKRALNRFRDFISNRLVLTPECSSPREVESVAREFDVLVTGSDQIWNPTIIDGLDLIYFLGFNFHGRRVAFASSMGSYRYSGSEEASVKGLFSGFDSLSVREADTAEYISKLLGGRSVDTMPDPTLLLNSREWSEVSAGSFSAPFDRYMLVYTLKKNEFVRRSIERVSSKLGLKVVAIDQDPFLGYEADAHFNDIGPAEYLSLFRNASFVVTNSFHGTAFSLNFSKPFIALEPESGKNRIMGLLSQVGALERFVSPSSNLDEALLTETDWSGVEVKLNALREHAKSYLSRSLP